MRRISLFEKMPRDQPCKLFTVCGQECDKICYLKKRRAIDRAK
jgi:hypothetical protein